MEREGEIEKTNVGTNTNPLKSIGLFNTEKKKNLMMLDLKISIPTNPK